MIAVFTILGRVGITLLNIGLAMGLTFGALILLRPVTGRLLRPRHQVWLWFVGWYLGYLFQLYDLLGQWVRLPFSFRDLIVPRVEEVGNRSLPTYISDGMDGAPSVMLPGGGEVQIPPDFMEKLLPVIGVVWMGVLIAAMVWYYREDRRLRRLGQQGEKMDRETMAQYGITQENVVVRLCEGLPASFVRFGHDTGWGDGARFVICLQKELPQERMRLVLLHEMKHIKLHHAWYKSIIVGGLTAFYWWNPIMWLAYRLTCRDMELACDQAVLEELEPEERRDYARTLVELGSGRHLWGSVTSFGECDAALRVRRAAEWKPEKQAAWIASAVLTLVLVAFFYCGGPVYDYQDELQGAEAAYTLSRWPEYLEEGAWVAQVARQLEKPDWQPREVWSKASERLVVLDEGGQWYALSFVGWSGEAYRWINITPMRQAFLDGYTRIA